MSPVLANVLKRQSSYKLANSPPLFCNWIYGGLPITTSNPFLLSSRLNTSLNQVCQRKNLLFSARLISFKFSRIAWSYACVSNCLLMVSEISCCNFSFYCGRNKSNMMIIVVIRSFAGDSSHYRRAIFLLYLFVLFLVSKFT